MGFISFNENYYSRKLLEYENRMLSDAEIYEVKQILKVLDDLTDEGYTNLNDRMEADFSCLTRLRNILQRYNEAPFSVGLERLPETVYCEEEYELRELLEKIIGEAGDFSVDSCNPFLERIQDYCSFIGCEEDTAYVFLLRDTLLPYVFFSGGNRESIYPWLISRRFLSDITKRNDADDDIRLPLYEALESGHTDFDSYAAFCKERILPVLDDHPELKTALTELLGSVKQNRIVVIESGYMGTIPMMLAALDDRVDFRLYTTAPFLYETYRDRIFCQRYEDIRNFETLYAQDLLLRYSSYRDGRFYVKVSEDTAVRGKSLAEIRRFMPR